MKKSERYQIFCEAFLQSMDPAQAAQKAGLRDGFACLAENEVRQRLEQMRERAAEQIRQEDIVRALGKLAFGSANDAIRFALRVKEETPEEVDLSAVSEFKVTEKGIEMKLVDRIHAMEVLHGLLANGGNREAEELYQALMDAADRNSAEENPGADGLE